MTLGDFLPTTVRQGQTYKGQKRVRFETVEQTGGRKYPKKKDETRQAKAGSNRQQQIGKTKASVGKTNAKKADTAQSFTLPLANRFLTLATDPSADELIREVNSGPSRSRTTASDLDADVPIITKVKGPQSNNGQSKENRKERSKAKKVQHLRVTVTPGQPRTVTEESRSKEASSNNVPRFNQRPYLESNKIREWLEGNIQATHDDQVMTASQGANEHVNRFVDFAVETAFTFDKLTRALFDVQVWSFYIQLGTKDHQPYWAKEVVREAKTRDDARARQTCENKIVKLNAQIKSLTDELQTTADRVRLTKAEYEEVMFSYMNESLTYVRRQNELKMRMAKIERAEFVAWENFMILATPAQKALALTIKNQLMLTRRKNMQYEEAAAHATPQVDMLPKGLPSLELRFKFDEKSMSEENAKDIYKSMGDITREYRLRATELYIRTAKVELDYHTTRLRDLLDGSVLAPSEREEDDGEAVKAFQVFIKVHRHHTAALAETEVLRLKERFQKADAPDPIVPLPVVQQIPVSELLNQVGQIREVLLLNKN